MSTTASSADVLVTPEETSKLKRVLKIAAWAWVALFFLTVFTLVKLPQDRLRNLVNGHISAALAPYGISFIANESRLSIGFGVSYIMRDVTLNMPPPADPVKVEKIVVSPSFVALLTGRMGADLSITQGKGGIDASVAARGTDATVSLRIDKLDLGKLGVAAALVGVRAGRCSTAP